MKLSKTLLLSSTAAAFAVLGTSAQAEIVYGAADFSMNSMSYSDSDDFEMDATQLTLGLGIAYKAGNFYVGLDSDTTSLANENDYTAASSTAKLWVGYEFADHYMIGVSSIGNSIAEEDDYNEYNYSSSALGVFGQYRDDTFGAAVNYEVDSENDQDLLELVATFEQSDSLYVGAKIAQNSNDYETGTDVTLLTTWTYNQFELSGAYYYYTSESEDYGQTEEYSSQTFGLAGEYNVSNKIGLFGGVMLSSGDYSDTTDFGLGARYNFTDSFSASLAYNTSSTDYEDGYSSDVSGISFGVSWNLGDSPLVTKDFDNKLSDVRQFVQGL